MIALVAGGTSAAGAREHVPLPKPRPAEAPQINAREAEPGEDEEPAPAEAAAPDSAPAAKADAAPATKPPSECRLALTEQIAIAPSIPDITGPGACGGPDLVRLEAVVLPDGRRVSVSPAATLRCGMARAIADWVRADIAPLGASLGSRVADLDNFDSYECRGRNRVRGAKLSEHGRANALDVRGIKLADGRMISLTDRDAPRAPREAVMQSVCARFTTVLGPGSDGYHEDHIHLDLAERRGGYRMCQWALYEGLPNIAPVMPLPRPAEAPPREVAADEERAPQQAAPSQPEAAEQVPAEEVEREQAETPPPAPPKPTKRAKAKAAAAKPAASKPIDLKPQAVPAAKPPARSKQAPARPPA
ncbi:extensin family protein [Rhodopseudomonas palustris]|uniref:extensin family protein n=1 Tax=Rhodopseudomonas palustris TaxID=1076 RepID=UPI0021F3169A|nr:extensin family protein [Rhodopseudomonas palustris]UYO53440.1 extensin family protein [Rhodopseudomonas palustris]